MTGPSRLAEDLQTTPRWSLTGARFRCADADESIIATIALDGGRCLSTVTLRLGRRVRSMMGALARSGYITDPSRGWAHRQLRGLREACAEIARLESVVAEQDASLLPARARRPLNWPRTAFPEAIFKHLRSSERWQWQLAHAERKGRPCVVDEQTWGAVGWCDVLLDVDVQMEVGVQLYPRQKPLDDDFGSATRTLRQTLRPFGYRSLKMMGQNAPKLVMMDKGIKTIAEARRERHRLDRLVFGAA